MTTITFVDRPVRATASIAAASPAPTFDDVLTRFEDDIYRLFLQLASDQIEADELYHELLIDVCHTFDDLDGVTDPRGWIYNLAISAYLRRQRNVTGNRPLVAATGPERLDGSDAIGEVDAFIGLLPPKQRAALVLRRYHGFGYDEIGKSLNASEAAARAITHAALRTLVERFGDPV